jgi:hypothetical protein
VFSLDGTPLLPEVSEAVETTRLHCLRNKKEFMRNEIEEAQRKKLCQNL